MKDKSESYEAELNNGSQQPVTDEVVNAVASTKSIMHYLRASTWPMSAPNRTRKARQLVNFLNLHREDENVSIFSDTDQNPQAPGSPGSLLSRATQLALEHLDLGSSAPGHLSKVLNKQATAGFSTTGKFLHTMSENSRLTSPPPSDLSSVSSDEPSTAAARASAPLSGILCSSSSSSHAFNRRRRRRNTNNDDSTAVNVDEEEEEEEDQDESGCFTAATTATTSSSTNQGQKSPSSSMSTPNHQQSHHNHRHHHHHQVRIIDNRLKKPADEAALLHARRRLPHRFTRSCTSNDDDEDDNEEEGDNSVAALQKHVILLSRDAETMTPLQTATRRHSSFVSPAAASASPSASASCTTLSGALKRCNTTSSVYEPGKSTLKRERAKQQRQPQPQNQNFTSSDEVETDYGGGGGVVFGDGGGGLSVATNMEPICVVNLATPISRNISFESSGQSQQPQQLDPQPQQRVNLLVEGVRFVIDVERLRAHPDTMLGRMFSADSRFLENTHLTTATPSGGTTTTTTTTCEDEDENEEEVVDGNEEEDSGSSSVCSGRAMDDVEQWMAVASTSTALVSTHSAPASYRSHRGSVCGRRRRRRRKGDAAASSRHHRKQQRKRHSQGTNTAAVAAVETGSDVCLTGSGVPANVFRVLLDFYLKGKMVCTPDISVRQLKQACEYFLIPFNHETVSCSNLREFLHEVSNDGAHAIFEEFLEVAVVPQFMECARQGERECHIVILTDDEHVHWDDQYPPQMPEAELSSHIIYSTRMYRFLKYIENREIAKQVLTERGLKKIRIGIEGYPTCKERMKFRVGSRPEAIYNYVQRPFLRMSWEQEENKSRHVDFQCVKSKSVSDLASLDQAVIDRPPSLTASAAAAASPTGAPAAIDPVPPRYSPSLPHPHHTGNQ